MKQQLAVLRMSGAMQQSADVMKSMQGLCKVSEVSATMRELSKEMMKAGVIEEMMDDAFEGLEDDEELEEDVQKEVDKVLFELTVGQIGKAPDAVRDSLPVPELPDVESEPDEDVSDMQERLKALRS
jgi:charged multivesicular body protein 3